MSTSRQVCRWETFAGASMISAMNEAEYICDHCGEEIVIPIDPAAGSSQRYVEDCPVCCNPNVIHVEVDDEGQPRAWSTPEQDRY